MHTVGDFVRVAVGAAVGCGLYDSVMFIAVSYRQKKYAKAMAAQVDAMNARYEALKAQAEAKKP